MEPILCIAIVAVARKFYTAYSKNVERQKGLDQKLSFENIETNKVLILIPAI